MKNLKGSLMLLLAAFFWGTTFVAQSSASESIGAFTFNATRSFVGSAFLAILMLIINKKNNNVEIKNEKKSVIYAGIICGLVLFAAMNTQQWGIVLYPSDVPSSGRSGFLTATYVVIVAVFARLFGKKIHKIIYLSVVMCIIGLFLLCVTDGFSSIYLGDVFGIICAFCFALHIMVVDKFSHCDSVKLSCVQFFVTGVLSLVAMFIFEKPDIIQIREAWFSILYAGILSSGVAYTLQMAGQKYAEPAVASVVMSLESVFAAIGGCIVLNEVLSIREIAGCIIVFLAVVLAQIPSMVHGNNVDI